MKDFGLARRIIGKAIWRDEMVEELSISTRIVEEGG